MSRFKLCFIFDDAGDYKPVPYSKLMDGRRRRKEYENKYFLPLNGYLLEVSHEDYLDHYKATNRQIYIEKEARRAGEVSLQSLGTSEDEIINDINEDIADLIISEMMVDSLHNAIGLLSEDERKLIRLLYFDEQTERQCAEIFSQDKSTINKRKKRILKKILKILE